MMTEQEFIPKDPYPNKLEKGSCSWQSPSNIALVKYWGKREGQLPENPSISFTLNNCFTTTRLEFELKASEVAGEEDFEFELFFEGEEKEDFRPKVNTFFKRIEKYCPFLRAYRFTIYTENSFPHSSGIASSASGMSALALCVVGLEKQLDASAEKNEDFYKRKASFLARLGSGSACRSIDGDLVVWGEHEKVEGSSDLYGIPYPGKVHEIFKDFQDSILLVDRGTKQVSSSVGHNLMYGHPFAEARFVQARENLHKLQPILESGDLDAFIEIVESEALSLHAMMMSSKPYFILIKPNTLQIINKIWEFRREKGVPVCFTLDAGANVHVLYPAENKDEVSEFVKNELVAYCENGHYICDRVGSGAKNL